MSNTTVPIIDGSKKYHRIRPPIPGAVHTQQPLNGMPYYSGLKSDALRILRKSARQRTEQETELVYSYLHSIKDLIQIHDTALRKLIDAMRYEYRDANDVLYCKGEIVTCWYILLSGSVFMNNLFLPVASFGKRSAGCSRRISDCLILESSEMIAVDYQEGGLMKPSLQRSLSQSSTTGPPGGRRSRHLSGQRTPQQGAAQFFIPPHSADYTNNMKTRYFPDEHCHQGHQGHQFPGAEFHQLPPHLPNNVHHLQPYQPSAMLTTNQTQAQRLRRSHNSVDSSHSNDLMYNGVVKCELPYDPLSHDPLMQPDMLGHNPVTKRHSRASDTSSAYSGSDKMQASSLGPDDLEDDLGADMEGTYDAEQGSLKESLPDSDDEEEGYDEPVESLIVRDTVRECLEKDPADRTENDIEVLLEFLQHLPAFANMTLAIRRSLCAVMVFAVVETAGTVVMNDGEELDSWSVILNGHVEIKRPDDTIEHLHMGDSFGITPTMEKLHHKGVMCTRANNCQFVCIAQSDYYRILHQGEENTKRHEEDGHVVLVTEHRILDSGNRKGHIVIRGTPDRLMQQLIDEHSQVDPTYVEDFLLTYRTFLSNPHEIATKLLAWFNDPDKRAKVTRVVLLWVNNHFNDFETQNVLSEFLEQFEALLEKESMGGQLRLLNIACATKAQARTVVLTRATREEILNFSVLGGIERGCGIFISKVEPQSKAHESGLKRGDQILTVNNQNFEHISHNRALEVLRGTTHLSITVKSNILSFKEMLLTPDSPSRIQKKDSLSHIKVDFKHRLTIPGIAAPSLLPNLSPVRREPSNKPDKRTSHRARIRAALRKMSLLPKNGNSDPQLTSLDDNSSNSSAGFHRKGSGSSNGSLQMSLHLSASNPDLSSNLVHQNSDDSGSDRSNAYPEHVLKIYKSDQTCKYFLVHRDTTAREVVMLAVTEFGLTEPSSNFSLNEVSIGHGGFVKQKRLPEQMSNLPDSIGLNSRYYLKNNHCTDPLVPDDSASELLRDTHTSFLQLQSAEIAAQLTLQDFRIFTAIRSTEYMDDLFELESKYGREHLQEFTDLVNREMFWVVTEVCSESNIMKRMKIIKQFIKIARHCKECKNFNSMFAIVSGLGHGSVSRLRNTWEKLPNKYNRLFGDLQDLMDPSMNMSKYRNMVNSDHVQPPMIPFFPVIKKDLTFIHLGNDSKVDNLINFEKLRMIAKEIRNTCNMAAAQYDLANMLLGGGTSQSILSAFSGTHLSSMATLRRKRRNSAIPNAKRMFDEAQMVRRVKQYLTTMKVTDDENKLQEMSIQCEALPVQSLRKRDPSPSPSRTNSSTSSQPSVDLTRPVFGAEQPDQIHKMLALSSKSRPSKHVIPAQHRAPLPPRVASPGDKGRPAAPVSPRQSNTRVSHPTLHLSPESSSVISLSNMHGVKKSNSVGSGESASPTNSIGSAGVSYQLETDSGHNSISSYCDSHSMSSQGSNQNTNATPPQTQKIFNRLPATTHTSSTSRPPLPSYDVLVQKGAGTNSFMEQQYRSSSTIVSTNQHQATMHTHNYQHIHTQNYRSTHKQQQRPPLPDYQEATQRARQIHQGRRTGLSTQTMGYYNEVGVDTDDSDSDLSDCTEQVSAV